jgi:hypothetical protein
MSGMLPLRHLPFWHPSVTDSPIGLENLPLSE